ncbi:MAG: tetratricopeptide repeat protein [Planctomycetaceae bacterium]|nr:tetratricopeptide repeat protein [Planctomycetaceae bacterium]
MVLERWKRTAVVLLGVSLLGCKSGTDESPRGIDSLLNRQGRSAGPAAGSGSVSSKSISNHFKMKQASQNYFVGDRQAGTPQGVAAFGSAGNDGQTSFGKVATVVKNALTIDPKVIHSADPTDLAHDPGKLQPKLYLSAAALHEQAGDLESAAEKYEQLLAIDATHREALVGYGRLQHRRGDLDGAIEVYRLAATHYGEDPVILNDLGLCLARAGRAQEAVARIEAAIQLKPESLLYRNNLAAVLVEADRSAEAVTALQHSYGPAVAHYNVAYLLKQQGKSEDAIVHFNEALKLNPSMKPARIMLEQMSPQIGTLPQRLQRLAPQEELRTSRTEPADEAATALGSKPHANAINALANEAPQTPTRVSPPPKAMPVAVFEQAVPVEADRLPEKASQVPTFVAQATFEKPVLPTLRQPASVSKKSVEHVIRVPAVRKTKPNTSSLVPPSPAELKTEGLPNFLPVRD